ncbi:unnamed protein product [Allacma fusca]|uniref:Uncharacterized protein n=1 Tax=Allacma fusca TaxID=39272 RepID=A0A8J2L4J3_9HEXA|nr:unnamed protein product [Allacma fusca]
MLKLKERHVRRIVSKSVKTLEIIAARPLSKCPDRVQQHKDVVPESVQSSRSNDLVISDQIGTYHGSINSESSVESTFQNIDCLFPEIGREANNANHHQRNPTFTNFRNDLKHWALTHQIKQKALTHLLHILRPNHYTYLPNDPSSGDVNQGGSTRSPAVMLKKKRKSAVEILSSDSEVSITSQVDINTTPKLVAVATPEQHSSPEVVIASNWITVF